MAERFLHTFDEWMTRVNKRLTQLERRKPFSGGSSTVPDPLIVDQLQVTGSAIVPTPTLDSEAANKGYVDDQVAGAYQHLQAGDGIAVTGDGSTATPWVVTATGTPSGELVAGMRRTSGATAIQSVPNNAETVVTLMSVAGGYFGGVVGASSGLVVPVDGYYMITGTSRWAANATGNRRTQILLTTGGVTGTITRQSGSAANAAGAEDSVAVAWPLLAGDLVQLQVFQNSGAALNLTSTAWTPNLSVALIGRTS